MNLRIFNDEVGVKVIYVLAWDPEMSTVIQIGASCSGVSSKEVLSVLLLMLLFMIRLVCGIPRLFNMYSSTKDTRKSANSLAVFEPAPSHVIRVLWPAVETR